MFRINEDLDAQLYQYILDIEILSTLYWYELNKDDIFFQHDNNPKHTARSTKKWLEDNRINFLGWSTQLPDLNYIEYLWNEIDRRLRNHSRRFKNKDDL